MENFGLKITEWTKNDLEIKKLQKQLNEKKEQNKNLSNDLLIEIQEKNLNDNIFKISSLKQDVFVRQIKVSDSLSLKYLEFCIAEYFKENSDKSNSFHLENLLTYIKQKRTVKTKTSLEIKSSE
jgi:hypothetical protein